MRRLCILVGMTVFGSVGWWLGERVGFMTAFLVSGLGSFFGIYVGWKLARSLGD